MIRGSIAVLALALTATACGYTVQSTSGTEYLAKYPDQRAGATTARTDASIVQAASVEPNLQFPGRFGLARIINGQLSAIPDAEMALWADLARRNQGMGSFHSVSPLVAELTAQTVGLKPRTGASTTGQTVEKIRLGAARQHLDAVLIYEVGANSTRNATPFALADLTIIGGAFLPTRQIKAEGRATALFVDVRNGYPYGTAHGAADLSTLYGSWGAGRAEATARNLAIKAVVEDLMPNVNAMMVTLRRTSGPTTGRVEPSG